MDDVIMGQPRAASALPRTSLTGTAITGVHYVCAADGVRVRLLVGPFATAEQAQLWVDPAQDLLLWQGDLEAAVEAGVSRLLTRPGAARPGDLNQQLGLPHPV